MAEIFDDGILTIYRKENRGKNGSKPKMVLVRKTEHYFGFERVGLTRYYTAKRENEQIDTVVHIHQDREISSGEVAVLEDGKQYTIRQAQHGEDGDGLRITVLSLERLEENYEFG